MQMPSTASAKGCGHQDDGSQSLRIAAQAGIELPSAHTDPEAFSRLAALVKAENGADLAFLPLCCTVEAEALGAHITLGNAITGPRPAAYAHESLRAFMDADRAIDFTQGRIAVVLEACRRLKQLGIPVAVEISGPVSILSALIEFAVLFKSWRKDEALTVEAFNRIGIELERYTRMLRECGADLISYADPAAAPHIIGPRFSGMLARSFLAPFLSSLTSTIGGASLHLCPHSAAMLVSANLAEWTTVSVPAGAAYQQACLEMAGNGYVFGRQCIKRTSPACNKGHTHVLQLHKAQEA